MQDLSTSHILIIAIVAFMLYHLSRCSFFDDSFSVGGESDAKPLCHIKTNSDYSQTTIIDEYPNSGYFEGWTYASDNLCSCPEGYDVQRRTDSVQKGRNQWRCWKDSPLNICDVTKDWKDLPQNCICPLGYYTQFSNDKYRCEKYEGSPLNICDVWDGSQKSKTNWKNIPKKCICPEGSTAQYSYHGNETQYRCIKNSKLI